MEQENQQSVYQEQPIKPIYPNWPTSKPGPRTTTPVPGTRLQVRRTDQVVEVGYDQETGEPGSYGLDRSQPEADLKGRVSPDQEKSMEETAAERSRERHQKQRPR